MLGEGLASHRANRLLWVHMRVQGAVRIVKRFTVTSHTTWWLKGAVDQNMELLALGWLGAYSVGSRHAAALTVGYGCVGGARQLGRVCRDLRYTRCWRRGRESSSRAAAVKYGPAICG